MVRGVVAKVLFCSCKSTCGGFYVVALLLLGCSGWLLGWCGMLL